MKIVLHYNLPREKWLYYQISAITDKAGVKQKKSSVLKVRIFKNV